METLGTYEMLGQMTSQNSGFSLWGFGQKNGEVYFIKQFLSPKYPVDDTVSSQESLNKKIRKCQEFERQKIALYEKVEQNTDGNAVTVEEFFRIGSKYYIATKKMDSLQWTIPEIAAFPIDAKRRLCAIIAHCVGSIHRGGVVHADLKHENLMFISSRSGKATVKVIDFDSSFLESNPPKAGEEIVGDQNYFSPEACISIWGGEIPLTCKMDVFALGVLFHQYFSGELPGFDKENATYPGEAVAKGQVLKISDRVPENVSWLLERMLMFDFEQRPTAMEAFQSLMNSMVEMKTTVPGKNPADYYSYVRNFRGDSVKPSTQSKDPFRRAGDL